MPCRGGMLQGWLGERVKSSRTQFPSILSLCYFHYHGFLLTWLQDGCYCPRCRMELQWYPAAKVGPSFLSLSFWPQKLLSEAFQESHFSVSLDKITCVYGNGEWNYQDWLEYSSTTSGLEQGPLFIRKEERVNDC